MTHLAGVGVDGGPEGTLGGGAGRVDGDTDNGARQAVVCRTPGDLRNGPHSTHTHVRTSDTAQCDGVVPSEQANTASIGANLVRLLA